MRNMTLAVTLACVLPSIGMAQFLDVDPYSTYAVGIASLAEQEILVGYDTGVHREFFPNDAVNRVEALKVALLAARMPITLVPDDSPAVAFGDVNMTDWYGDYVHTGVTRGVVRGYDDGTFKPDAGVTRAELLVMLGRAFFWQVAPVDGQEWWEVHIDRAIDKNLLPDSPDPHAALTRGEVAEIVYRTQQIADEGFVRAYRLQGRGLASYYAPSLEGNTTAFGDTYDPQELTAAHRTLPYNTKLRVMRNGVEVIVRVNDRGPYVDGRVIDLSEIAFDALGDLGEGVIEIEYEVVVDTEQEPTEIPDAVAGVLQRESVTEDIPDAVGEFLAKPQTSAAQPVGEFDEELAALRSIAYLNADFYETVTLRHQLPAKVQQGAVLQFSGRVNEYGNDRVRVFLQPVGGLLTDQRVYEAPLSGKNFVLQVPFLEAGKFQVGLTIDEDRTSKIFEMDVVPEWGIAFPPRGDQYDSTLDVKVDQSVSDLAFRWTAQGDGVITKIQATDGTTTVQAVVEHNQSAVTLPRRFFAPLNLADEVRLTLHHAQSGDGSWHGQTGAWRRAHDRTYSLLPTYKPKLTAAVTPGVFPRYIEPFRPLGISATFDPDEKLADMAFVITPNGLVETPQLLKNIEDGTLYLELQIREPGPYVVQISAVDGRTLWAEALYARHDDQWVLPVQDWPLTPHDDAPTATTLRDWNNALRAAHNRAQLLSNASLNSFAQGYANEMAQHDFLGHVGFDGRGFPERIRDAGLQGKYGENVAVGSTLDLALKSLEQSASHRKNMLDPAWNVSGVGIAQNQAGDYYVAFVFGERPPE